MQEALCLERVLENCIFCKIARKEIPAKLLYEDEFVLGFHDVNPVAPTHVLVIPKKHIHSLNEISPEDGTLLGKIFFAIQKLAIDLGFAEEGYRVINNVGKHGGQTVFHIHFHIIAGKSFGWPPFANR